MLGYESSYCTVARYTCRFREAQGFKPRQKPTQDLPKVFEQKKWFLTVRRAVWLVLRKNRFAAKASRFALRRKSRTYPTNKILLIQR